MIQTAYTITAPARVRLTHLVGVPYRFKSDTPSLGLDCLTCAAHVYDAIGQAMGDPDAWRFPIPDDYETDRIPKATLLEWATYWTPTWPIYGALVDLGHAHVGVLLDGPRIIHADRHRAQVVIHRLDRLQSKIGGYFRLREAGEPAAIDHVREAAKR